MSNTLAAEAKLRAKEEKRLKKEARKKEKKLKKEKMREKAAARGGKDPHRKKRMAERADASGEEEEEVIDRADARYLPNDQDFPDIRKFNEVTPSKPRGGGESLYAAALAAVRKDERQPESRRQRQEGEEEAESDSNEEDGDSDYEDDEDYSQGSSVSELDSEEEPIKQGDCLPREVTSAALEDDLDDGDDVIVFQPLFSQQQHPSPIGRPSPSSAVTPVKAPSSQTHNQALVTPPHPAIAPERPQEMGGIDFDSLAYLRALHHKNTQQGWLSSQDSDQPSLSFENSVGGRHPFRMGEPSSDYDYWGPGDDGAAVYPSPSSNLMRSQLGYQHEGPSHSIFSSDAQEIDSSRGGASGGGYSWSNHLSFTSAADVAPPPGFMDLPTPPSRFPMDSTAANFLPTSLRGELPQSTSSSSILSMLYGSDPVYQHDQGGYHNGT